MKNVDDLFYVQRVKAGDIRAFSALVHKYQSLALTLVMKMADSREEAEDITQEIFIKVFKSLEQFREESQFSTWFYRIAYNTALSEIRRKKIDFTSYDTDYSDINEEIGEDTDDLDKEEKLRCLETALKRIPPDEAFLISLFYLENQSTEEISRITGLSVANVKVKLHRIRKKLALEINKLMTQ